MNTKNKIINGLNELLSNDKVNIDEAMLENCADKIIAINRNIGIEEVDIKPYLTEEAIKVYEAKPDVEVRTPSKFGTLVAKCEYLGITYDLNSDNAELEQIKKVAKIFNFLVEKKAVTLGILTECKVMKLARISPMERSIILLYVYSNFSKEELNLLCGFKIANQEGELPQHTNEIKVD